MKDLSLMGGERWYPVASILMKYDKVKASWIKEYDEFPGEFISEKEYKQRIRNIKIDGIIRSK